MNTTKKAIRVGGKDVFDMNLIYSRVLGLQQSCDIDFTDVLRNELAPLPTSVFKDTGDIRTAAGKSSLKQKLNVILSSCHIHDAEVTIIDGCAILWCIHWPCKGTVHDYIDNFCTYVINKTKVSDVYVLFDRYFDYNIKSVTRSNWSGQNVIHMGTDTFLLLYIVY